MRMVIVEDHAVTRASLRARLEALGAEAVEVDNGSEALTCIAPGVQEAKPFTVCLIADDNRVIQGIAVRMTRVWAFKWIWRTT